MLITYSSYKKLISVPKVPPETGGILIGHDSIIDSIVVDAGMPLKNNSNIVAYIPNVNFLNKKITEARKSGKSFYGIYHSHAIQWKGLSGGDILYINEILRAMPSTSETASLYFPIIYPGWGIDAYIASKINSKITINHENITIV